MWYTNDSRKARYPTVPGPLMLVYPERSRRARRAVSQNLRNAFLSARGNSSSSLRITSLADPHSLTPIELHPYQKHRGGGIRGSYKNSKTLPGFSARPNFQSLTNCSQLSSLFGFLCFHALTHCPICNPFVFMTLQPYRGGGYCFLP